MYYKNVIQGFNLIIRIFLIALLLCSKFIFNSMGVIDENSIGDIG